MTTGAAALKPRVGDRVSARWYDSGHSSTGTVTELSYKLRDGSRVYSVKIDGTEYSFNERDLTVIGRLPADVRRELRALEAIAKRLKDVGPAGRKWLRDVLTSDLETR